MNATPKSPHLDAQGQGEKKARNDLYHLLPNPITDLYVICGHQSKTLHDFLAPFNEPKLKVISRHYVELTGSHAAGQLAAAVSEAPYDPGRVIVLQRGGGSANDLAVFDSPEVISAIRESSMKVVTAIGHTGDVTEADREASASMTTPGALGGALSYVVGRQWVEKHRPRRTSPVEQYEAPRVAPAPPPPRPTAYRSATNGMGTASVIIGVISICVAGGLIVGPLVGLILGLIAVRRRPRTAAVWGIVLNTLALLGVIAAIAILVAIGTAGNAVAPTPGPS